MDDQHHEQRTGSSTRPDRHKPAVTSHRPDLAHQPDDSFLTGRRKAAQRFFHELTYPHNIHPALVPGVSVEDQRIRYRVDKVILTVVGALIVGFIIWGMINPGQVTAVSTAALNWTMLNLGWIFNTLAVGMILFLLVIAFSSYGRIPLGLDGEKPEYSTASWAAMLFGAGIGIGIIFFGPYEPMTYYLSPRPGAYDPATVEAIKGAMAQAALHWGVSAWAIYAIVGLAVGYVSYRRGRVPLMSSILMPLIGGDSRSAPARIIDGLAIIATLFGTAASLGIGALQIARGVEVVTGWGPTGNRMALIIIVVLTIGTIISAVAGIAKGIRRLSNFNMFLAIGLALFFFVVGPTIFLINIIPGMIVQYFDTMPQMLSASMADSPEMQEFLSSWTTFYWAWWVSWSPFVGVFTAKISRGRTIRQFILGVLLIPSTIIVLAFTILGGTAIWLQRTRGSIAADGTAASLPAPEEIFFVVLDQLPGAHIMAPIVIVMLAVFFITTADSASLVNSQLSQGGKPEPNKLITAFWAVCMAGIAVVMLLVGGEDALTGLQNLITVTALPFSVVLVLMCIALVKELRSDPQTIRKSYERWALQKAIRRGIDTYGDDFTITIEPTDPRSEYATGAGVDSHAEELTNWYARTDEDGNPVPYDYATGRYLDGKDHNGDPYPDDEPDAEAGETTDDTAAEADGEDGAHAASQREDS
ncbi:BCCT family transporter [Brevibacterium sp. p3-SID960]|uniref:BCCT family transporter n=1 Tax=Brevibacterium sp. p3-SID960 TaxID=2916063 RepID=UPI0021A82818|nr:BCCT family transporter [Brevibacterium sp. p3-SID960]MCT1691164.1 BCCT family transporter [Brevibacterium sp. p3-SID960]